MGCAGVEQSIPAVSAMLSVAEALSQILEQAQAKASTEVGAGRSLGLVLAEDAASDIDSPPHDKSMVDGYAVLAADFTNGRAKLGVLEEITAGIIPSKKVVSGFCSRIMTGAPLPDDADAIVMVERTKFYPSPLAPLPQGERGNSGTLTPALSQRDREGETLGIVEIQDERLARIKISCGAENHCGRGKRFCGAALSWGPRRSVC